MMEKFKQMLKKKAQEGKFISDEDKAARQEMIDEIRAMAQDSMGSDLKKIKDMKKVTVASDSAEGLKAGLEKAEDVVEAKMGEESESEDDSEEEACPMCKDGEVCPECQMKMASEPSEAKPEMSDKEKIAQLEAELAALKGQA